MTNNKQTSLDWFLDELLQLGYIKRLPVTELQQAKAMHKEEMVDFAMKFMMQDRPIISFYNETFGARPMDMVIIEGCEYLEYSSGHRYSLCHKGNCKNPIHPENKGRNK